MCVVVQTLMQSQLVEPLFRVQELETRWYFPQENGGGLASHQPLPVFFKNAARLFINASRLVCQLIAVTPEKIALFPS